MELLRKYGVSTSIRVPLVANGVADFLADSSPEPAFVAADCQISKDDGAFANCTNALNFLSDGIATITLTTTELEAAVATLVIKDTASPERFEPTVVLIATYGDPSAEHAFDLDTSSVAQTGDAFARLGAPVGASISADIAAALASLLDAAGRLETGTLASATSTTAVLPDVSPLPFEDSDLVGAALLIVRGSGRGQGRLIDGWEKSTRTATVKAWNSASPDNSTPDNTSEYVLIGLPQSSDSLLPAVNTKQINDATVNGAGTSGDKWRG